MPERWTPRRGDRVGRGVHQRGGRVGGVGSPEAWEYRRGGRVGGVGVSEGWACWRGGCVGGLAHRRNGRTGGGTECESGFIHSSTGGTGVLDLHRGVPKLR